MWLWFCSCQFASSSEETLQLVEVNLSVILGFLILLALLLNQSECDHVLIFGDVVLGPHWATKVWCQNVPRTPRTSLSIVLDCMNLGRGYLKSLHAGQWSPHVILFLVVFLLTIFVEVCIPRGGHRRLDPMGWTFLGWQPWALFCSSLHVALA